MREARKQLTPQEWEAKVQEGLSQLPPAQATESFTKEEWLFFRRVFVESWLSEDGYVRVVPEAQLKVQDALDRCWAGLTQEEADSIANYRGGYGWE